MPPFGIFEVAPAKLPEDDPAAPGVVPVPMVMGRPWYHGLCISWSLRSHLLLEFLRWHLPNCQRMTMLLLELCLFPWWWADLGILAGKNLLDHLQPVIPPCTALCHLQKPRWLITFRFFEKFYTTYFRWYKAPFSLGPLSHLMIQSVSSPTCIMPPNLGSDITHNFY